MARRTKKYNAAMRMIRTIPGKPKSKENADVYAFLNAAKWYWDHKTGKWFLSELPPSNSVFEASKDGDSTGIVKIRLMCHPEDMPIAVSTLEKSGFSVLEASDPYPNRKGVGVRVYCEATLPKKKSR